MGFAASLVFALLLFVSVVYAQQLTFTPGPTRTPNADHQSDQEHHKLLRQHDRDLHAWYRSNLAADAAANLGAAESANEDARAEERELAEAQRQRDSDYQEALRVWDRARQKAYRDGTPFTTPRPSKPDGDDLYATAEPTASALPTASPSAGAPAVTSPIPTVSLTPHEYDKLLQAQIRLCDQIYQAELRAWDSRKSYANRNGQTFSEPRPTSPDCEEVAEEAVAAILGANPSPVARVLAW